jgi:hypothetical protein
VPTWQVFVLRQAVLSEIAGNSLSWVKLFEGLALKINRKPGRVAEALLGGQSPVVGS